MSAVRFAPCLAVMVVLQFCSATPDFSLPPFIGGACSDNVCGKGKCVKSTTSNFGFECQCEGGWKQARFNDDQNFKFLPCVIPNCTTNYSCANATAPPPRNRTNTAVFDPCYWADCGGGSCNRTSPFTRSCTCEQGYYNLLNSTNFPCYKECEIGLDCARLGIGIMNSSNPTPPPSSNMADNSNSLGTSLIPRAEFSWWIAMATTLGLAGLKYS